VAVLVHQTDRPEGRVVEAVAAAQQELELSLLRLNQDNQ
jgi:hypothetical protein